MKTALITGGSGGIGSAVAMRLAADGFAVIITYNRQQDKALQVIAGLSCYDTPSGAYCMNVADSASVNAAAEEILRDFGHIDVLVNNAGTAKSGLLIDMSDEDWNEVVSVNLTGCFNVCRAFLPGMLSRGSGRIINISSVWGQTGASVETAYSASKAGVIGLTKALAKETSPMGITVNCVAPGVVDTRMMDCYSEEDKTALCGEIPLGRMARPDEIASAVAFLAGEDASYVTGAVLPVNGGFFI